MKNISIFIALAMAAMIAISCDKKEESKPITQEKPVVKEEPKAAVTETVSAEEAFPVKENKAVLENGGSLAKLYPDSWIQKAEELGIPILDKYGEVTTDYNQKVYSYIFPGDYVKEGKVYDKNDKIVDFQARLRWRDANGY